MKKSSLVRHLVRRLLPAIALLVILDLGVTWVLTRRMYLEEWQLGDVFLAMLLSQLLWVALFGWALISGLRSALTSVQRFVEDNSVVAQKRFIGHAAHQLRTPLSALRLETELMLAKELPPDLRMQVERINLSTERMIRLGQQLLVLARVDSAASPKDRFIRLDLCEWARTSGAEWLETTKKHQIGLVLIAPDHSAWVDANPLLLDELLGNLIDNALRYAQAKSRITLRVTVNPPTLSVEDDGIGINLNEHHQVFEAFYRGEQKQSDGSGLGLAIVKEIALAHGAGWNLLSRPHVNGTRISIVFPGPRMGTGLDRRIPPIN